MAQIDGSNVQVIDPGGGPGWRRHLLDHLKRLDPEAQRLRFMGAVSAAGIAAHVARADPLALVVFAPDGAWRGCAELHPGETADAAEIAVSVETAWQNRGIGAALTAEAGRQARRLGRGDVRLTCLRHNTPMMRIARHLSARALPLADWALALFRLEMPDPS
ncbi:MAG: N-acetyltransferase family protein [Alkalilacustris sp.]